MALLISDRLVEEILTMKEAIDVCDIAVRDLHEGAEPKTGRVIISMSQTKKAPS